MAHTEPQAVLNRDEHAVGSSAYAAAQADSTADVFQPKGTSYVAHAYGPENGHAHGEHGVPEYVGDSAHNEVLEAEAESKGLWFAYVKTKQFWLVLVLGQGTPLLHLPPTRLSPALPLLRTRTV